MPQPSNETIYELLKEFKVNTENHFKTLNGQVRRNTNFRNQALGGFGVIAFMGITIIVRLFT